MTYKYYICDEVDLALITNFIAHLEDWKENNTPNYEPPGYDMVAASQEMVPDTENPAYDPIENPLCIESGRRIQQVASTCFGAIRTEDESYMQDDLYP